MPPRAKTVDEQALDILSRATVIPGNRVKLSGEDRQLDPAVYRKVDDALRRIGGKWKGGKIRAHQFEDDPTSKLAKLLDSGEAPPMNPDAFFATPQAVADIVAREAMIVGGIRLEILEPSAGDGSLVRGVESYAGRIQGRRMANRWTLIELDAIRAAAIDPKGFPAAAIHVGKDFLSYPPCRMFDRVLMNPPFSVAGNPTAYIDHVKHAFDMLVPGGRLVAVCPIGFTFSDQSEKVRGFRGMVERNGRWNPLPDDAFRDSGTSVKTCIVILNAK